MRSIDEPIRLGTMLWVLTDPHHGHEFAYNRWYERDHYYAGCMIGEYTLAGSRWVATARHKAARLPASGTAMPFDRDEGSYACLYFVLDGHHDEWDAWAAPAMHAAVRAGPRLHAAHALQHRLLSARLALLPRSRSRCHSSSRSIIVIRGWWRCSSTPTMSMRRTSGSKAISTLGSTDSPVATVMTLSSVPLSDKKPDFIDVDPRAAARRLQIHFVEQDPLSCWDRFERLIEDITSSGTAQVALAAPFIPTVIGTDRYVDELW